MEDSAIVALYLTRDETAIDETAKKYGKYCFSIASGILKSHEDAEESVSDAYMNAWNSIPPHRPQVLSTFMGKLECIILTVRKTYMDAGGYAHD